MNNLNNNAIKIRINHAHIVYENINYLLLNKEIGWESDDQYANIKLSLESFIKNRDKLNTTPYLEHLNMGRLISSGILVYSKNINAKVLLNKIYRNGMVRENFEKEINHLRDIEFFDELTNKRIFATAQIIDVPIKENINNKFQYILFYKPYGVLCQFTKDSPDQKSLDDFNLPKGVYPAGRLDKDSEGLLLLSNDGPLMNKVTSPKNEKSKTYLVQVEGSPCEESLKKMRNGLMIQGKRTLPCRVSVLNDFVMNERTPPVRKRKNIPTTWIEVVLKEGRNRQVRRMTAAINHPTLRLVRSKILNLNLNNIVEGQFKEISRKDIKI